MSSFSPVEKALMDWGASFFNEASVRRVKGRPVNMSTGTSPRVGDNLSGQKSARNHSGDPGAARRTLTAIAMRTPEAMVKISGGGKGMIQIKNHLSYISRNGKIELETHDGEIAAGKAELALLRDAWKYGDVRELPEETDKRQALNIVLSMPEGTDALAVKRAARDFAAAEFSGHQYAMALHTYDTDPDPKPAKHPHVHLVVKVESMTGIRLNPRKADLQRWREGFAHALGAHGIEATATPRLARLNLNRGMKKPVLEMNTRGVKLTRVGQSRAASERVRSAVEIEHKVLNGYHQVLKVLAASPEIADRQLALDLIKQLSSEKQRPSEKERPPLKGKDR